MSEEFLLQEDGSQILLEDGSGSLLLESSTPEPEAVGQGGEVWLRQGNSPFVLLR